MRLSALVTLADTRSADGGRAALLGLGREPESIYSSHITRARRE
jgi:hypothetical protein